MIEYVEIGGNREWLSFYLRRSRQIRERKVLLLLLLLLGPFFSVLCICKVFWGVKMQKLCLKRGAKRQKLCQKYYFPRRRSVKVSLSCFLSSSWPPMKRTVNFLRWATKAPPRLSLFLFSGPTVPCIRGRRVGRHEGQLLTHERGGRGNSPGGRERGKNKNNHLSRLKKKPRFFFRILQENTAILAEGGWDLELHEVIYPTRVRGFFVDFQRKPFNPNPPEYAQDLKQKYGLVALVNGGGWCGGEE